MLNLCRCINLPTFDTGLNLDQEYTYNYLDPLSKFVVDGRLEFTSITFYKYFKLKVVIDNYVPQWFDLTRKPAKYKKVIVQFNDTSDNSSGTTHMLYYCHHTDTWEYIFNEIPPNIKLLYWRYAQRWEQ